jgi:hypothetical protein
MDSRFYLHLADQIDLLRDQIDLLVASKNTMQTRQDAILAMLKHMNFGTPLLTIHGANKDNLLTTVAMTYLIAGKPYNMAATAEITTLAATAQAVLTKCWYLVQVAADGTTFSFVKGVDVLTAVGDAAIPEMEADVALVGAVHVQCENAATFTLGTTAFDAADVTAAYFNAGSVTALAALGSLGGAVMGDLERIT